MRQSKLGLIAALALVAAAIWGFNALTPNTPISSGPEKADAHGWHWVKCVGTPYWHLWLKKHNGVWIELSWGCGNGHRPGDAFWLQTGASGVGGVG